MYARMYAQALIELGEGKSEKEISKLLAHFFDMLKSKGHLKLLPQIFSELGRRSWQENKNTPTLLVEKMSDSPKILTSLKKFLESEDVPFDDVIIREDKTLGGGYRFSYRNLLRDGSYKSMLLSLYHSIIRG